MSDPIDSSKEEVREWTLRTIGFLTSLEMGELDHGADLLSGLMSAAQVHALVTALLRLCYNFASDVARLEDIELTQLYERAAARVISE